MTLGPEDIVRKTFNTTRFRGGYVVDEVDGFLEEVVASLRRLTNLADEHQAQIHTLKSGGGTVAHDLEVETAQLEQVRLERDAIVGELAEADSRVAAAREAALVAEESRNTSLEELRKRFDDDLIELEQKVTNARATADAAERESARIIAMAEGQAEAAQQQTAMLRERLAVMINEVRAAVTGHLGADAVEELVPLTSELETDPVAQASAMALLAERLRHDHLSAGQREAERILGEAALERDALVAEGEEAVEAARKRAAGLLSLAQSEAEHTKEGGRKAGEKLLAEAQRTHDEKLASAETQVVRLVDDAHVERDAVLADLLTRREALEGKIAELETVQREYRQRLRSLISEQLAAVDTDEWEPVGPVSPQPARIA
ncbi:DivIVA domain-containing protein [Ornithinimicrobium faecis]|uniref:Cell wall synthesis protein Wag31 n=1 Tax=Ornithinimicrobium faecis TaxID=2934158 RepID=A0ABY4YXM6_9MICO|nr:DivIVA domain-containing protein [Ornithinimicrobium sp. HY1793]USQ81496.1 DivIVA domain-containing protein [Ornithinimicrobium sp. HY1793]